MNIKYLLPLLLILTAILTACPNNTTPMPEPPPPATIPAGQTVIVDFPPDGHWHPSGFLAQAGDILVFNPKGEAAHAETAAILLHIGRTMTQTITPGMRQKVTRRGEIVFRADPVRLGPISSKTLQIEISNHKEKTE